MNNVGEVGNTANTNTKKVENREDFEEAIQQDTAELLAQISNSLLSQRIKNIFQDNDVTLLENIDRFQTSLASHGYDFAEDINFSQDMSEGEIIQQLDRAIGGLSINMSSFIEERIMDQISEGTFCDTASTVNGICNEYNPETRVISVYTFEEQDSVSDKTDTEDEEDNIIHLDTRKKGELLFTFNPYATIFAEGSDFCFWLMEQMNMAKAHIQSEYFDAKQSYIQQSTGVIGKTSQIINATNK